MLAVVIAISTNVYKTTTLDHQNFSFRENARLTQISGTPKKPSTPKQSSRTNFFEWTTLSIALGGGAAATDSAAVVSESSDSDIEVSDSEDSDVSNVVPAPNVAWVFLPKAKTQATTRSVSFRLVLAIVPREGISRQPALSQATWQTL